MATKTSELDVLRLPKPTNESADFLLKQIPRVFPALPPTIGKEAFAHACIVAANELTKPCTPVSVLVAALNCAKMGLIPGSVLGLAYFVPFKNKRTGKYEAQLIVGYRGMTDLAYETGFLKIVNTEVLLQGETFKSWNDEAGPHFRHDKPIEREISRNTIIGTYCWGQAITGGDFFKYVSKADIEKAYNDSSDAWRYHYAEMAMKTAIRRASKRWKLHGRMALAVRLDEIAERAEVAYEEGMIDADYKTVVPKDVLTSLKPESEDPPPSNWTPDGVPTADDDDGTAPEVEPLTDADIDGVLGGAGGTEEEEEDTLY